MVFGQGRGFAGGGWGKRFLTPAACARRVRLRACPQLICWGNNQVSRVHNHAQSHCWLTCLVGEVVEKQFVQDGGAQPPATSPRGDNPNLPGGRAGAGD